MKQRFSSALFPVLVLFLLTIPLILPYTAKGFFPTHDGEWAVVRLADMYREVRDGQIPPRFSGNLNFGYGYPLFHYAYPMPYYLGLPFFLAGLGLVDSIKLLFALSVPLSAILMYYASYELFRSRFGSLAGALVYAYLPYRMVDLYVRGSLGESLASVLFPLILLAMIRSVKKPTPIWISILSLAFAALILTHNIMAVLFSPIIAAYLIFLFLSGKRRELIPVIGAFGIGAGLAAFFWLPAILEKHWILLSRIPIADRDLYYVPFRELFYSAWGYGTPTDPDRFTYQMGPIQVLLLLLVAALTAKQLWQKQLQYKEHPLFLGLIALFVVLLFPVTSVIWEHLPLLKEINYPWTLLLPIGFLVSLLVGSLDPKHIYAKAVITTLVLIMIAQVIGYAQPQQYVDRGDGFYFTNDATTTSSRELMPLWVKTFPSSRPQEKVLIESGSGTVSLSENTSQLLLFQANLATPSLVRVNTIYFPGWTWYEGQKVIPVSYANEFGVMEATLPAGAHTIRVVLENTPVRTVANTISVASLLGLGGLCYVFRKQTKKKS